MTKQKRKRGQAKFIRFFGPVLDALRELGGSGTPTEVTRLVAKNLKVSEEEQAEQLKSGTSRFANQVAWARNYLKNEGLIDASKKGVWVLTEKGTKTTLSVADARNIFLRQVDLFAQKRQPINSTEPLEKDETEEATTSTQDDQIEAVLDHREAVLNTIKKMSPSGFERLCQRLLRESGFVEVEVTGRSGDQGIDGWGILQINTLVSMKVLFQCKRYADTVNPDAVRSFRGTLEGRADKGILLTTGNFTSGAFSEANRDGAKSIELVDGQKIVDLLEKLELGLKPRVVYEVDGAFFDQFN